MTPRAAQTCKAEVCRACRACRVCSVQACRRVCPAAGGGTHTLQHIFKQPGSLVGQRPSQPPLVEPASDTDPVSGRPTLKLGSQVGAASEHSARHWPGYPQTGRHVHLIQIRRGRVYCHNIYRVLFVRYSVLYHASIFSGVSPQTEARQTEGGTAKSFFKVWARGSGCGVIPCRQRTRPRPLQAKASRSVLKQT